MKRFFPVLLVLLLGTTACEMPEIPEEEPSPWDGLVPFRASYSTFTMPFTADYEVLPETIGTVHMSEASGLAWSRTNPGKIWAHNDSGHASLLFLLDASTGEVLAKYRIAGAANIDWEDMEVVGDHTGSTIYVADIGDNDQKRSFYKIYRLPEPTYDPQHYGQTVTIDADVVTHLPFTYPDGSHNAESFLVDPFSGDFYIVTKSGERSALFVWPFPQHPEEVLLKAGEFGFREASAATCSPDGLRVLIKNRQDIFYWIRASGETMLEMLAREPVKAPYAGEPQGEAVCFDTLNNYFTLSEALNSTTLPELFKYHFLQ